MNKKKRIWLNCFKKQSSFVCYWVNGACELWGSYFPPLRHAITYSTPFCQHSCNVDQIALSLSLSVFHIFLLEVSPTFALSLISLLLMVCLIAKVLFFISIFVPFTGRKVHFLPVRCSPAAGGSAHARNHGGVWLACFFHRHFKVPGVSGVHQHAEDNCGSQVMKKLSFSHKHTHSRSVFILNLYL